ncbi:hypothetical protein Ahy_A04g019242 [Arachis hypogaea]|uniref:PROP1-like PPR domain-containing protein n=1 Tax=Arachis hypogaea TaxID=3818 RepID=A0A445DFK2_ARAHY|nr:hypothetical protein Ahy_A04g019242 [Arachis hypogaea]
MITPRRRALLTSDPAVPNLRSHRRRSRTLAVVLTLKQPTRFRPSLNSPFLAKQFWNCPPEVEKEGIVMVGIGGPSGSGNQELGPSYLFSLTWHGASATDHSLFLTFTDFSSPFSGPSGIKHKLEHCGVSASSELVVEVLSRIRNDWEAAFTFFLWAGKQPKYAHSVREYHSMISILAKMRKFDTAWTLIEEMRGGSTGPSLVTPQTLMIMIRRYCAVHDVGRAINTFYVHKRFNFQVGLEEFQGLLSALCRYKNVEDAEHLLFCNKNVFPLDTKSFNIILNGWCNLIVSTRNADRIWQEMSKRGIRYDVVSYSSIISCYSKTSTLYKVLKLFDEMKTRNITPDRKVYNAVIHALAKARHIKEAVNLIGTMEANNVTPDAVSYNSLIKPLCKARKMDEAKEVFDDMLKRGLSPTVRTFHAFFRILRTREEVFELLDKMRELRCCPTIETYIMLIRKFCRWRQLDDVLKIWNKMREDGVSHDRSSYIVLIHGLFLNEKLEEAHKYYVEMLEKGFAPEPKTEKIIQAWIYGRQVTQDRVTDLHDDQVEHDTLRKKDKAKPSKFEKEKSFLHKPETRRTGVADPNKSNSNVLLVDYKVSAKRACDESILIFP